MQQVFHPGLEEMANDGALYSDAGHLAYYLKHGLSPTCYDTCDLTAHLQRRESLYRSLGLPPIAFKDARVLEIAAGTGQNSVYVACCRPTTLTLLEPNPIAREELANTYVDLEVPHTKPQVEAALFQDFAALESYDIVICENWLGHLPGDRVLVRKLGTLVAPGGALVITVVPMTGFVANVVRKIMADCAVEPSASFQAKSESLLKAFSPHLSTIRGMTRSHTSWVHDCMLNPHFLNVVLPLEVVLAELGYELALLGTNPVFHADWRWFKTLHGNERHFNEAMAESFLRNAHNFIDYQHTYPPRDSNENRMLQTAAHAVHAAALAAEKQIEIVGRENVDLQDMLLALSRFVACVNKFNTGLGDAFAEAASLLAKPSLSVGDIACMQRFAPIFGRETIYSSLTRTLA
jgi:SAM-dependent methyltransferase